MGFWDDISHPFVSGWHALAHQLSHAAGAVEHFGHDHVYQPVQGVASDIGSGLSNIPGTFEDVMKGKYGQGWKAGELGGLGLAAIGGAGLAAEGLGAGVESLGGWGSETGSWFTNAPLQAATGEGVLPSEGVSLATTPEAASMQVPATSGASQLAAQLGEEAVPEAAQEGGQKLLQGETEGWADRAAREANTFKGSPQWVAAVLRNAAAETGSGLLSRGTNLLTSPLMYPGIPGMTLAGLSGQGIYEQLHHPQKAQQAPDHSGDVWSSIHGQAPGASGPDVGGIPPALMQQLLAPPPAFTSSGGVSQTDLTGVTKALQGQLQGLPKEVADITAATDKSLNADYAKMNPSMVPIMKAGESMIADAGAKEAKLLQGANAMLPSMLAALQGAKTRVGTQTKGSTEYLRAVSEAKTRVANLVNYYHMDPQEAADLVSQTWGSQYGITVDPLDIIAGSKGSATKEGPWMRGIDAQRATSGGTNGTGFTAHHIRGLLAEPNYQLYKGYLQQYSDAGGPRSKPDFLLWLVQRIAADTKQLPNDVQQGLMDDREQQVLSLLFAQAGIN